MTATIGNSFGCCDPDLWYNIPQLSSTGRSSIRKTLKYNYLVNSDGELATNKLVEIAL